jgi:glycosyltransferase involved in cell wall biosynthesis
VTLLGGRVWDGGKNVGLAVQAAQRMPSPGRVLLAGDQRHPETGTLAHIPAPIECLGWLSHEELTAQLGRARVFLAPARYEPFGLLPLQAAVHGCALLLADTPSFRELWEGCALFFHPDDPGSLRAAWERLLDDDALASDLGARAERRARDAYSAERMAAEYLSLYARLPRGVAA